MQAFILGPYSWKAYGIRLNSPGLCNIGKIFLCLPWPAFILVFPSLFILGLVCPQLWIFRTCGNPTRGAFVFPPRQSHALHDSWLEDRHDGADASLSIHDAIKGIISASLKTKNFLIFHTIWPNTSLPSTKINYRISCPITIHCRTPNKASQTCWPCQ